MKTRLSMTLVFPLLYSLGMGISSGGDTEQGLVSPQTNYLATATNKFPTLAELCFTTAAYRKEALRMVLEEANKAATELRLPESLPITETNLVEDFIDEYAAAKRFGAVGNVSTSNYIYSVSKEFRLCYVDDMNQEQDINRWAAEYLWPLSLEDTNAAYELATQWLGAVSADVAGLNRDFSVSIESIGHRGSGTNTCFVPVYVVNWKTDSDPSKPYAINAAVVALFLPTKTLVQLRVNKSKYNLRNPLEFTNLVELLSDTNSPVPPPFYRRR